MISPLQEFVMLNLLFPTIIYGPFISLILVKILMRKRRKDSKSFRDIVLHNLQVAFLSNFLLLLILFSYDLIINPSLSIDLFANSTADPAPPLIIVLILYIFWLFFLDILFLFISYFIDRSSMNKK